MRRVLLIAPAAAVLAIATGAVPTRADVLIGDASPLTGPISWVGAQYLAGTELAVDDLNAKGGVLGEQVQLISVDDACDTEQPVVAAQKLVSDGVSSPTKAAPTCSAWSAATISRASSAAITWQTIGGTRRSPSCTTENPMQPASPPKPASS